MTHRLVSHDTRAILSYVDLIWPDLDLDLSLASASYLHKWHLCHPFSSIFAQFALAAVSGLVSAARADRAKRVNFDL